MVRARGLHAGLHVPLLSLQLMLLLSLMLMLLLIPTLFVVRLLVVCEQAGQTLEKFEYGLALSCQAGLRTARECLVDHRVARCRSTVTTHAEATAALGGGHGLE